MPRPFGLEFFIFGPRSYGGLELPNVYTSQCIGQLSLFLGHLRAQDKTGSLIHISMSYLQLTIGSRTPFLCKQYPSYAKWIDHNWLTSLWCFLHQIKFIVDVKREWLPVVCRQHDVFLMDSLIALRYSPKQLHQLNQCRIYLQV